VVPGIPLPDFSGHVIEKKHLFGIEAESGGAEWYSRHPRLAGSSASARYPFAAEAMGAAGIHHAITWRVLVITYGNVQRRGDRAKRRLRG
jgi:hypothetical protein